MPGRKGENAMFFKVRYVLGSISSFLLCLMLLVALFAPQQASADPVSMSVTTAISAWLCASFVHGILLTEGQGEPSRIAALIGLVTLAWVVTKILQEPHSSADPIDWNLLQVLAMGALIMAPVSQLLDLVLPRGSYPPAQPQAS
ncbi:MAG TPA: hypothetical protein VEB18_04045 [Candidatus Paceibacterota bacterium]|nr:hypothetical protein [Candidatus Paceibacterota bacterium]